MVDKVDHVTLERFYVKEGKRPQEPNTIQQKYEALRTSDGMG